MFKLFLLNDLQSGRKLLVYEPSAGSNARTTDRLSLSGMSQESFGVSNGPQNPFGSRALLTRILEESTP
jgi:hypothetical protein